MELKQKQCFHGLIVSHWTLEPIESLVRQTAEFVNLYSTWRGQNRFTALLKTFDLLRDRPEVRRSGVAIPSLPALRRFVESGVSLGSPELARAARESGDLELASVLAWSEAVNARIAETVRNVAPFPGARESLARIRAHSDALCVSQTPVEALVREWEENGLRGVIDFIAGQELGTKSEHLDLAGAGKYPPDRILMIGDAQGDMKAARQNRASFFPINPGREAQSWARFLAEAYDRFLGGTYAGAYEQALVDEFNSLLPAEPPW